MQANYQILRSSAGFRIGFARLPDSECAAVSIHIPAGSRDDPPGQAGLAHFVEHMIFKGTEKRDARQISIETEDVGASLNASTSEDQTVYEARGDASTLPLLVDILCDMVWHSTFPEDEIPLERDVIAEEIVMYQESPSEHISDLISKALWSPHPLGESVSGTLASIRRIDRKALLSFSQRHHRREDVVISVAGPFEEAEVLQLFEAHLPPSTPRVEAPSYQIGNHSRKQEIEGRDTLQVQLALGYASFGLHDPRRHALRLLAMILGEGASSRLFQELREDRGLCYQVCCDVTLFDDTGALVIHAGLDPASRDEALACIYSQLAELSTKGPNDAELARAKRLTASSSRAAMECTAAHAEWVGECLIQHNQIIRPREALELINQVTADEIRDVAACLFVPANEALAEIRPA
ncbi:M16 family metallopeptidase [Haloferula chungangensis]|uniref:M16 family metallopeptidase n=1 Tax=Haloferula chungangensis TaxID=1048331 RepID=A0ABW2L655_9BACT